MLLMGLRQNLMENRINTRIPFGESTLKIPLRLLPHLYIGASVVLRLVLEAPIDWRLLESSYFA